jgi:hypothetical protein
MMKMSRLVLMGVLLASPAAFAQTTRPAAGVDQKSALSLTATQAFNRGEFAVALPLLKKLASQAQDDPTRLSTLQDQIRVCETKLKDAPQAAATPLSQQVVPQPDSPPTSAEKRKPHPAPVDGVPAEMTIKELGNFDYDAEKGGGIPGDVKALAGSKVRLRGFMIPMDSAERITQFALVPSLFECCFGQPPQIQHTIIVNCPKGKAVAYYPDEISVEGKLSVNEQKEDGFIVSVFQMDAGSIKPAAK